MVKSMKTNPDGLIRKLKNMKRPALLLQIDQNIVKSARKKLSDLSYKYYQETCSIRRDLEDNIQQYKSYLKGARVKTKLNYRQYEQKGFFGFYKYKPTQQIIDRSEELFVQSELRALGKTATPDELAKIKDKARIQVEDYMKKMANDEVDPRYLAESNIGKETLNEILYVASP